MSRVCTYLNFMGNTEEAFEFYASVFHTTYAAPIVRFSDMPGGQPLSDEENSQIMNIQLPILNGHIIMGTDMLASMRHKLRVGTDMLASMRHKLRVGNNTTIVLETDSREQADELYDALSAGGSENQDMSDMPWGAYWGVCLDRYDIRWMITHTPVSDPRE